MGQKYYIEQGEGSEFLLDQLLHPSKSYLYAHAQIKSPSWLVICDLVVAIFAVIQVAKNPLFVINMAPMIREYVFAFVDPVCSGY